MNFIPWLGTEHASELYDFDYERTLLAELSCGCSLHLDPAACVPSFVDPPW